jgi:hypothetical protein
LSFSGGKSTFRSHEPERCRCVSPRPNGTFTQPADVLRRRIGGDVIEALAAAARQGDADNRHGFILDFFGKRLAWFHIFARFVIDIDAKYLQVIGGNNRFCSLSTKSVDKFVGKLGESASNLRYGKGFFFTLPTN